MALRDHSTLSEILVIFLFAFSLFFVFYLQVRWLLHVLLKRSAPFWPGKRQRPYTLALNAVAWTGLACVLYGFFVEPTNLEVTRLNLTSPRVSPQTGRLRLIHLSDIHADLKARNEPRAAALINALDADLVLLTGDYINDEAAIPVLRTFLASLKAKHGVFAVKGNMDLGSDLPPSTFAGLSVPLLNQQWREVDIRGTKVRVSGMEVGDEPFFKRFWASRKTPPPAFEIFLFHYTDLAYEAQSAGIDLYLAGHTHGGQIRLPFYGALVTLAKLGKRFEAGLYRLGSMTLYVSRGLGMEGGSAPRVRFLCRPEITVIDVTAAAP